MRRSKMLLARGPSQPPKQLGKVRAAVEVEDLQQHRPYRSPARHFGRDSRLLLGLAASVTACHSEHARAADDGHGAAAVGG